MALKVLPAHLTLREESVARFKREAATAARLKHPGIVKIYAVGTEGETHFFAMEFVEGAPLDRVIAGMGGKDIRYLGGGDMAYAVAARRHRRERDHDESLPGGKDEPDRSPAWERPYVETVCRLATQVADALDYAHKAGVIHRDVKPSNILVRKDGTCVLTDFGLAREKGLPKVTVTGEFAGTPHYVSPEQAKPRSTAVDHRADIYSLGVTLYELLTLKRPFDGKTSQEIFAKILSREPPQLRAQNPQIPRDLETICMTAIEKDRGRRYQSAAAFKEDLDRFLAFMPVTARPVGVVTRTFRLIRRNPAYSMLAAFVFLVLVVGPLIYGFQQKLANIRISKMLEEKKAALSLADEEAERARREAKTAKQVSDFLVELFNVVDPSEARGERITAFEILKQSVELARIGLAEQPGVQVRLWETLGLIYQALGLYAQAEPLLKKAMETHQRMNGEGHASTLRSMHHLADLHRMQGRYTEAEPLFRKALAGFNERSGEEDEGTLAVMNDMAMLYMMQNRIEEAEGIYKLTLDTRRRILGNDHPDTLESMDHLAVLYTKVGRFVVAESLYNESLEGRRSVLGHDHPDTLTSMNNLAVLYRKQGRFQQAESLYIESQEGRRRVLGDEHPDTVTARFKLAMCYLDQDQVDKAEPLFLRTLEDRRRILGEDHPKTWSAATFVAQVYQKKGMVEEAESLYKKVLNCQLKTLGPGHNNTLFTMSHLACLYHETSRNAEAEPLAWQVVEHTPKDDPSYAQRCELLKEILEAMEKEGDS